MDRWLQVVLLIPVAPLIWSWWRWRKVKSSFTAVAPRVRRLNLVAMILVTLGVAAYLCWIVLAPFITQSRLKPIAAQICFDTSAIACLLAIGIAAIRGMGLRLPVILTGALVEVAWTLIGAATY